MEVIGLCGLAGAGKSTVAKRLVERHGFVRVKFAGGLKAMFRAFLAYRGASPELIERMVEGDLKEAPSRLLNGRTPRHAMIALGTGWGRELIDFDLWVDAEVEHVQSLAAELDAPRFVFDDVRQSNEVEAVRRLGGSLWRVERDGLVRAENADASERLDVPTDLTIRNRDGAYAALWDVVDAARLFSGALHAARVTSQRDNVVTSGAKVVADFRAALATAKAAVEDVRTRAAEPEFHPCKCDPSGLSRCAFAECSGPALDADAVFAKLSTFATSKRDNVVTAGVDVQAAGIVVAASSTPLDMSAARIVVADEVDVFPVSEGDPLDLYHKRIAAQVGGYLSPAEVEAVAELRHERDCACAPGVRCHETFKANCPRIAKARDCACPAGAVCPGSSTCPRAAR